MTSSLGEHLRNARDRRRLQQKDVAEAAGVSQGLVSNWEKERRIRRSSSSRRWRGSWVSKFCAWSTDSSTFATTWNGAIVQSTKLTRREQDALLAAYGVFADRDSAGKAAFFRTQLTPPANQNDAVDQLLDDLSVAEQA